MSLRLETHTGPDATTPQLSPLRKFIFSSPDLVAMSFDEDEDDLSVTPDMTTSDDEIGHSASPVTTLRDEACDLAFTHMFTFEEENSAGFEITSIYQKLDHPATPRMTVSDDDDVGVIPAMTTSNSVMSMASLLMTPNQKRVADFDQEYFPVTQENPCSNEDQSSPAADFQSYGAEFAQVAKKVTATGVQRVTKIRHTQVEVDDNVGNIIHNEVDDKVNNADTKVHNKLLERINKHNTIAVEKGDERTGFNHRVETWAEARAKVIAYHDAVAARHAKMDFRFDIAADHQVTHKDRKVIAVAETFNDVLDNTDIKPFEDIAPAPTPTPSVASYTESLDLDLINNIISGLAFVPFECRSAIKFQKSKKVWDITPFLDQVPTPAPTPSNKDTDLDLKALDRLIQGLALVSPTTPPNIASNDTLMIKNKVKVDELCPILNTPRPTPGPSVASAVLIPEIQDNLEENHPSLESNVNIQITYDPAWVEVERVEQPIPVRPSPEHWSDRMGLPAPKTTHSQIAGVFARGFHALRTDNQVRVNINKNATDADSGMWYVPVTARWGWENAPAAAALRRTCPARTETSTA